MSTAENVRARMIINFLPNATAEEHVLLRNYETWADEYYAKAKGTKNPAEYRKFVGQYYDYKRMAEDLRAEIARRN